MIDEAFLTSLDADFAAVHAAASARTQEDVGNLLRWAQSDETRARMLARPWGGLVLWWPYLRATMGGNDRVGKEAVVRIVLAVDRLHGWEPTLAEAKEQTLTVLRKAFDPLELKGAVERATGDGGALQWAAPVVTPLILPVLSPGGLLNLARKVPLAYLGLSAAIVAATAATIPAFTGWSVASNADRDARLRPRTVVDVTTRPADYGSP